MAAHLARMMVGTTGRPTVVRTVSTTVALLEYWMADWLAAMTALQMAARRARTWAERSADSMAVEKGTQTAQKSVVRKAGLTVDHLAQRMAASTDDWRVERLVSHLVGCWGSLRAVQSADSKAVMMVLLTVEQMDQSLVLQMGKHLVVRSDVLMAVKTDLRWAAHWDCLRVAKKGES